MRSLQHIHPSAAIAHPESPTGYVKSPLCSQCGNRMLVAFIVPDKPGRERRTHKCPVCGNIETVETAV